MARCAVILLALCALALRMHSVHGLQNLGIIFGIERDPVQKNIFALDFSAGAEIEPTVTLVANMTQAAANDPAGFPNRCFGYVNGATATGPLYEFSPNGLAYDGEARLFFAAFDRFGDTMSRLCFYSVLTNTFEYSTILGDIVLGATFDAKTYQYIWIDEGKEQTEAGILILQFIRLDRATGTVVDRTTNTLFRNVTTNPNAPAAELLFTFRGGDMAVDCNGILYASSVGTGGGFKYFFSIDLDYFTEENSSTSFAYRLIHADPSDGQSPVSSLTGFATADQLAFDSSGRLISQDSERGIFSVVNRLTGANGELGVEGVDFVRLTEMGMLRTFADLASFRDCGLVGACVETEIVDPCEDRVLPILTPAEGGDIRCVAVDGRCRLPGMCEGEDTVDCIFYVLAAD
ncbi:hypothetical protein FVE85_6372 [Porphyridium purpureum]|uniref:Uncharacterized protein n=1 Tax=Porphyridium purpureum TaxID=35688 RepID=A0A5J4Z7X1_PORPP|nr:hypothetical protein FVE85_6372 [Porphyridium purpureum]|eukprot:POR5099..scf295_1